MIVSSVFPLSRVLASVRLLLYPLALLYGAIIWLRNRLYDSGFFSSVSFSIPVISVGNLSTGGTGKTPHVEYLIRLLQYEFKVATMSRGYKRKTNGFLLADNTTTALDIGDEPMQYHLKYPEVTVCVAEERMTGIPQLLLKRPDIDVILLDDAYQHRSVRPGINILITDYYRPFYKDHILPYGNLRESRKASRRADIIIVSKCPEQLTMQESAVILAEMAPLPAQQVFFSTIRYGNPYDFFTGAPVATAGKQVLLVCCIARPEPLTAQVSTVAAGVHVLSYPDHHYFTEEDMEEIKAAWDNWQVQDKIIVTTEKDATRLSLHAEKLREWQIDIAVWPIEVALLHGQTQQLTDQIQDFVASTLADYRTAYPVPMS